MRKSIYLLKTTPSSHTHRFHPLPLATPTSCSPHPLATPIHSTHSPQLSSILLTCAKFKVWMTIVESGWNVWVWLVGLVSRRWGVASGSGWNLWVWLLGVVLRRYIDFLTLLLLYLFFFAAASLLFCCHLKNVFIYTVSTVYYIQSIIYSKYSVLYTVSTEYYIQ